jgi:hypothetical protein
MEKHEETNPIPLEIAEQLCAEIRAEADRNWHTAAARWCWSCRKSKGAEEPKQPAYLQKPGNRGCILINARYAHMRLAEQ